MRIISVILTAMLMSTSAWSNMEVLFHPYDSTLKKIAKIFEEAEETIDMALYNVDAGKGNPIIRTLTSDAVQKRIQSGDLKVRIIFEGYESPEANQRKMKKLEAIGIDARFMGSSKKMHHKFATVDTAGKNPKLITGSANWSLGSRNLYNESLLFIDSMPGITQSFQSEYDLLWGLAKEYGFSVDYKETNVKPVAMEDGVDAFYNTDHFKVSNSGRLTSSRSDTSFTLTRKIVEAIDSAESKIEIATTRLKLRPIYEACLLYTSPSPRDATLSRMPSSA